jgi:hypothetical protein
VQLVKYSYMMNIDFYVTLTVQVRGMAVSVKRVRKISFFFDKHPSYHRLFFVAVCNPSCLNGGNCTAPNTCACKLPQL